MGRAPWSWMEPIPSPVLGTQDLPGRAKLEGPSRQAQESWLATPQHRPAWPSPSLQLPLEGIPGKYPERQGPTLQASPATCCPGPLLLQARAPNAHCLSFLDPSPCSRGLSLWGCFPPTTLRATCPPTKDPLTCGLAQGLGVTVWGAASPGMRQDTVAGPQSGVSWPLHSANLFWASALSGLCEVLGAWRGPGTLSPWSSGCGAQREAEQGSRPPGSQLPPHTGSQAALVSAWGGTDAIWGFHLPCPS